RKFNLVEGYEAVDFVHFGASIEPHNSILGRAFLACFQLDRGVKVYAVAIPLFHLRLINKKIVSAASESAGPIRFGRLRLLNGRFLCAGSVGQVLSPSVRTDQETNKDAP